VGHVLGGKAGSLGESSVVLVLLCGAYLIARKFMDWRIPAAVFGAAALAASAFIGPIPPNTPTPCSF
jgi:electron transport complex protein RnfD